MAQTAPPPPADAPRPLPRRGASSLRTARPPRLVPQDLFWIVALAGLALVVSLLMPHGSRHDIGGAVCAAGTTALLYLLGWRARDRATGVIAGVLLATSFPFAQYAVAAPHEALFVLLAVAALFSFVAGSSLLALAFAGVAALARPDGVLLGMLLLAVSLAQRRRRAAWGAAFFLGIVGVGWGLQFGLGHERLPMLHLGGREWLLTWAIAPGMAFLTWLLLPFCAELGEAPRRARWLPTVLWALVYFLVSCFLRTNLAASQFALRPLWFVLAAGGLSRLLPVITELPMPWARYLLAALAVLSLLTFRLRAEWPQPPPAIESAPSRSASPIKPAAAAIATTNAAVHSKAAPIPTPHLAVTPKPIATVKPPLKTQPKLVPKPQPKPAPKIVVAAPKAYPVIYHKYYRPRRTYRHYYRRY